MEGEGKNPPGKKATEVTSDRQKMVTRLGELIACALELHPELQKIDKQAADKLTNDVIMEAGLLKNDLVLRGEGKVLPALVFDKDRPKTFHDRFMLIDGSINILAELAREMREDLQKTAPQAPQGTKVLPELQEDEEGQRYRVTSACVRGIGDLQAYWERGQDMFAFDLGKSLQAFSRQRSGPG